MSTMLNLDQIITAAREMTGLTDIGEPDITEGLTVLIDSLNTEADLTPAGEAAQQASLTALVANRLRITDVLTRNPEIRDERVRGPIVILGLPRTGTTKLHRMLAAHPRIQSIPLWRLLNPAPLGDTPPGASSGGSPETEDPRIAIAEMVSNGMRDNHPEFFAGHPLLPREPDEEVWMQDLVCRGWLPCYMTKVPSYQAWPERLDMQPWYEYLHTLLQMFQWQDRSAGKTWVLKTPEHLGNLDLLFERFPDATIVCTHRDPVVATTSMAVLNVAARRMYTDQPDEHGIGRLILERWSSGLRSLVDERDRLGDTHRFVDAPYRDITGDIHGVLGRICAAAGVDTDDDATAAMAAWETDNPQHKHGRHSYTPEQVGLDQAEMRDWFKEYLDRFEHLL